MSSALKAIHKHCLMCGNEQRGNATKTCNYPACPLWPYRMGTRPADGSPHRPLKACRSFCVNECQAEQAQQVKDCQGDTWVVGPCPLYRFRMGRNPNISQEARARMKGRAGHLIAAKATPSHAPV